MAGNLIWGDSFKSGTTLGDLLLGRWNGTLNNLSSIAFNSTAGRFGGQSLRFTYSGFSGSQSGYYKKTLTSNYATLCMHFPFQTNNATPTNKIELGAFWDNTTQQVCLVLNPAGTLSVYRGSGSGGTALATSTFTLSANIYYVFELKVTFHGSAGVVELRVWGPGAPSNGVIIASTGSLNTAPSGNAFVNAVYCGQATTTSGSNFASQVNDYEHFAIADDFVGDKRFYTDLPIAAVSTAWTPNASTNLSRINESQQNGDTSYNSSSTPGQEDLFSYAASISGLTGILAVMLSIWQRKDDAGTRQTKQRVKSSSTYGDGATVNPSSTYAETIDIFATDPNTSAAWTKSGVDNMNGAYNLVA